MERKSLGRVLPKTAYYSQAGLGKKNSLTMKKSVRNLAQAGDAVLAFTYPEYCYKEIGITFRRETIIHIKERPNFHSSDHHGTNFSLEFWGGRKIVKVPLLSTGNLYQSIFAQNFSEEELKCFSHVVMKQCFDNIEIRPSEVHEIVKTYRLDDFDKSFILAKTEY